MVIATNLFVFPHLAATALVVWLGADRLVRIEAVAAGSDNWLMDAGSGPDWLVPHCSAVGIPGCLAVDIQQR